jgi:hypothetical protein
LSIGLEYYLDGDGYLQTKYLESPAFNQTLYLSPFVLGATATATSLRFEGLTAHSGRTARLCIYSNVAGQDYPGALLLDAGTVSIATTGLKIITISQSLPAGTYWLGIVANDNLYTRGAFGYAGSSQSKMPSLTSQVSNAVAWIRTGVSTLPATFTHTALNTYAPIVQIGF